MKIILFDSSTGDAHVFNIVDTNDHEAEVASWCATHGVSFSDSQWMKLTGKIHHHNQ